MEMIVRNVAMALLLICSFSISPAHAATIRVPADQPTIQAGIEAAIDADIVLVAQGTYEENIDFLGKLITLWGEAGSEATGIDGGQAGTVVRFAGGETVEAVIDGFTIRNGNAQYDGGGIHCDSSSATITNCTITGNSAYLGGGISCYGASPIITHCTISGNDADRSGGGIYNWADLDESSYPIIADCMIFDNSARSEGGGILSFGELSDGVYPLITNCTIVGNSADGGAGIFDHDSSSSTIMHCTISENFAETAGGGIFVFVGSGTTITNCILWGNSAPEGPELVANSHLFVSYSNVQGGYLGAHIGLYGSLHWHEGNIDSDPLFVGGGDYHLTAGSPCIDAGTDGGVYTDMDGDERPQGAGFDMGSDESIDCWDYDGDHTPDEACGGGDCDDADPDVNPDAAELCTSGIDEDCDGLVDEEDPDCPGQFTLELDAFYAGGTLNLQFTLGVPYPAVWSVLLILTEPTVQIQTVWTLYMPEITPPVDAAFAYPYPSVGWVGIFTCLYLDGLPRALDLAWVDTGG